MKVTAHPLVVAAALGLLGPAALADDEDRYEARVAGQWARVSKRPQSHPAPLGDRIEVIPFEGRILLDHGMTIAQPTGQWTRVEDDLAHQELVVGGARVLREFQVDGDRLQVRTTVEGTHAEFHDTYTRIG